MGLTRAQDSHDRFIFGSDIIKLNKNSDNLNILDVGCGSGNFYTYIKKNFQNHKYLGIDFDGNHIKASKFKQKEFKLITKDLRGEWFFGEFDFVWSSEVIEHIMDDNSFFSKLVKSTKKNGYIIITTPYINSIRNFSIKYPWHAYVSKTENGEHVRQGYSENDLYNFAKIHNLELKNIYFITECDDYRVKNLFKINNGIKCYIFNFLYFIKIFKYKRYVSIDDVQNKLKYYCIAAIFKKKID